MKHTLTLLFILGSFFTAFAQKSTSTPVITRYYYFTGTIDKYPVTFYLYRINDKFTGSYYYNSTEEPIDISGELDKTNFLKLARYDQEGSETELLSGSFKDSSFSGTWSSKGKLLPFRISNVHDNSGLTFDYIYTSGSKKLTGDENGRPAASYDAATIWPGATSKHAANNLLKEIIYQAFDEKPSQEPIGKIMIREKNEILNPGPQKEDESKTYALDRRIQVVYQNAQLLTLSCFLYSDEGGAHGNHGTGYTCIDLVNNRRLTITDVLDTLACRDLLHTLLEKKFRAAYHVKKEEKLSEYLFHDVIPPTGNFLLTSKGIGFQYNPYEIGVYALGEVLLYIPFKELNTCLKPGFRQLIGMVSQ